MLVYFSHFETNKQGLWPSFSKPGNQIGKAGMELQKGLIGKKDWRGPLREQADTKK